MEVDLTELPIPDWGLRCPRCNYELKGLPSHVCPECGHAFDVPALIRTWTPLREPRYTGDERPVPDFGLFCTGCRYPMFGWSEFRCPECGREMQPRWLRPREKWFGVEPWMTGGLLLPLVEVILTDAYIPYFTRDEKTMWDIVFGGRSIGTRLVVASEFFFDFLWTMRHEQQRAEQGRETAHSGRWRCPNCGKSVPGNFEICWSCGGSSE